MSEQSVFEKKYVEKDKMSDVEGVLEHFNLPPKAITFIRKNVRAIQVGIAVVVIGVVAFSLYGSYRDKKIENSGNALTLALEQATEKRVAALHEVVAEYAGTDAALWADVEIAHQYMQDKKYAEAQKQYHKVVVDISDDHPLYPLALFGEGQAYEGLGQYDDARGVYNNLKKIEGYGDIAYLVVARCYEAEGNIDTAITTYNEYLLSMEDTQSQAKKYVEGKIVRLQTQKK